MSEQPKDPIQEWLDSQTSDKTFDNYKYGIDFFLQFMREQGLDVDGFKLLSMREHDLNAREFEMEKRVLDFRKWIVKQPQKQNPNETYGDGVGKAVTTAVRSFFAYHRMDLKFRRAESKKLTNVIPRQEKYKFTIEDFRRMDAVADLDEKYVLRTGKSVGLRAEDFVEFTRGDLEPYITQEAPICITQQGRITKKEHVPAWPFIDADAQPIIKLKLEQMTREGKIDVNCKMFTLEKRELTRTLKRLCNKAGINTGNKLVKFHCLRAFLIDKLAGYMSESKWKQIVGKKISEGAYVSADELRKHVIRAMPDLLIIKQENNSTIAQLAKLEALKAIAQTMGIDTANVFKMRKAVSTPEQITVLEEVTKKAGNVKAGGLPYEQSLAKNTAKFLADVIRQTKEELNA